MNVAFLLPGPKLYQWQKCANHKWSVAAPGRPIHQWCNDAYTYREHGRKKASNYFEEGTRRDQQERAQIAWAKTRCCCRAVFIRDEAIAGSFDGSSSYARLLQLWVTYFF